MSGVGVWKERKERKGKERKGKERKGKEEKKQKGLVWLVGWLDGLVG